MPESHDNIKEIFENFGKKGNKQTARYIKKLETRFESNPVLLQKIVGCYFYYMTIYEVLIQNNLLESTEIRKIKEYCLGIENNKLRPCQQIRKYCSTILEDDITNEVAALIENGLFRTRASGKILFTPNYLIFAGEIFTDILKSLNNKEFVSAVLKTALKIAPVPEEIERPKEVLGAIISAYSSMSNFFEREEEGKAVSEEHLLYFLRKLPQDGSFYIDIRSISQIHIDEEDSLAGLIIKTTSGNTFKIFGFGDFNDFLVQELVYMGISNGRFIYPIISRRKEWRVYDFLNDRANKATLSEKIDMAKSLKQIHDRLKAHKSTNISFVFTLDRELIQAINRIVSDFDSASRLWVDFREYCELDLIQELEGLSSSYDRKKEYLSAFIDVGMISAEYPHQIIQEPVLNEIELENSKPQLEEEDKLLKLIQLIEKSRTRDSSSEELMVHVNNLITNKGSGEQIVKEFNERFCLILQKEIRSISDNKSDRYYYLEPFLKFDIVDESFVVEGLAPPSGF